MVRQARGFNRRRSAEVRIKAGSADRQEHRIPGTGAHGKHTPRH
ncbi:unnamed protein product [Staurois parvus]|uniref:Uncharacterized protein n=1 Tax=Staurois parvus TaxID=386267 RepID=A0ABN9EFT8_9NEOB|nr:unnamed protein product [Staurois parvus]